MFLTDRRFNVIITVFFLVFLSGLIPFIAIAETNLKPAEVNAQWGFINQSGVVVVPYQFERVGSFSNGLAVVRVNGQEGYIDTTGKITITPQFAWAGNFSDKIARVNIGGTLDGTAVTGGKWGFIDQKGKIIIEAQFEDAKDFAEGLAAVKVDGKWGYVDKQSKIVIKPRYTQAWQFSQSLALVRGSTYSYINPLGKTIVEPQKVSDWSDLPGRFSEDLAAVKIREKWGYIDRRGNIAIAAEYDHAFEFVDNIAVVEYQGKWGFINKQGIFIIQPQYEWADHFYGDRAIVKINGKYGFINRSGRLTIPAEYDEVTHFSEGLAAVKTIDGWGYLDSAGNFAIKPISSKALSFAEGMGATRLGPGWGYVNDKNQFIIPPKFDWAGEFVGQHAFVKVDDLYAFIGRDGNWVVTPKYAGYSDFVDGTALVSTTKWDPSGNIYIDSAGNVQKSFADLLQQYCQSFEHLMKEELSVMAPDGLKIYQEPDLNSKDLGLIPYGTRIMIIEQTFEPVELEGIKGHWVSVDFNGIQGYIFDGFLSHLEAPELGGNFTVTLAKYLQANKEETLWYAPELLMRMQESPTGFFQAFSGRVGSEPVRWDLYIPGISLREAFLLVRTLAIERVTRMNGQPVAEGTLIKDISFLEHNGRIVIDTFGVFSKIGPYTIIIEKEKWGYIHIYQLFAGYNHLK